MSKNPGNKSAAPRKSGSPLLTGILVGMIIGVAMAAGLAWWIMKTPSPFVQKEQVVAKPNAVAPVAEVKPHVSAAAPAAAQPAEAAAASGVAGEKPRFEFYKVLTDKDAGAAKPADKPKAAEVKPISQYLQAGSFSSTDDAEKLKAKLALLGFEAGIQTVTIPDKGVWHRVRLGPYKNVDELGRARTTLKQNGVDSTPIPAL